MFCSSSHHSKMSDSDSDCLASINMFAFPNENTIVRVKGPNFENTVSLNPNSNSTMMSRKLDSSQRREISPARSIRSVSSFQQRNLQQPFCRGGFAQSSMINGRCTSPTMSMRSVGSNMSVASSQFIISSLKNGNFNKYELRMMKDAIAKMMKGKVRKKIARRRNLKLFLKGARRKSGSSSGEMGSESSSSSDDCRSTRTGITATNNYTSYMNATNQHANNGRISDDCRSVKTDFGDFRRTVQNESAFRDCSSNFKKDSFRNLFNVGPKNLNSKTSSVDQNMTMNSQTLNRQTLQRDRFKNSFLLPSQRFNKTNTVKTIPEENQKDKMTEKRNKAPSKITGKALSNEQNNTNTDSDDDDDDIIFSIARKKYKTILKEPEQPRKRNLETSELTFSESKKTKLSSPTKLNGMFKMPSLQLNHSRPKDLNKPNKNQNEPDAFQNNDFQFAKPKLPIKNVANAKAGQNTAKFLSEKKIPKKSEVNRDSNATNDVSESTMAYKDNNKKGTKPNDTSNNKEQPNDDFSETIQTSMNDVSSRPSFMKRKLYTQTLDVTENKITGSSESSPSVSPHSKGYSDEAKEKNKTRKLATNQSCLTRDVFTEDSNLLDLIHKIVPPDRMNVTTNTTQKIDVSQKGNVTVDKMSKEDEKWDITSIITTCNDDDMSDTFTDEDIFKVNSNKNKTKKTVKKNDQEVKGKQKNDKSDVNSIKKKQIKPNVGENIADLPNTKDKALNKDKTSNEMKSSVVLNRLNIQEYINTDNIRTKTKPKNDPVKLKPSPPVKNIKSVLGTVNNSNNSDLSLDETCVNRTLNRTITTRACKAQFDMTTRDLSKAPPIPPRTQKKQTHSELNTQKVTKTPLPPPKPQSKKTQHAEGNTQDKTKVIPPPPPPKTQNTKKTQNVTSNLSKSIINRTASAKLTNKLKENIEPKNPKEVKKPQTKQDVKMKSQNIFEITNDSLQSVDHSIVYNKKTLRELKMLSNNSSFPDLDTSLCTIIGNRSLRPRNVTKTWNNITIKSRAQPEQNMYDILKTKKRRY